jgi:hypothetical protein
MESIVMFLFLLSEFDDCVVVWCFIGGGGRHFQFSRFLGLVRFLWLAISLVVGAWLAGLCGM